MIYAKPTIKVKVNKMAIYNIPKKELCTCDKTNIPKTCFAKSIRRFCDVNLSIVSLKQCKDTFHLIPAGIISHILGLR